jgi:hypothetical protein
MSEASRKEQEERALDALLVLLLRKVDKDDEVVDPKMLPELTEEEKTAMNRLGDGFIDRILAGEQPVTRDDKPKDDEADCGEDRALTGSGADCFMNRAEEVDDETAEELKRREQEALDRKKKRNGAG